MKSDLEIAREAPLRPIHEVAADFGLLEEELEPYGRYKAKIDLKALRRVRARPSGKYVLVTAVTPTPLGEGKTLTTLGLSMALARSGRKAAAAIRQPSMGPVFGVKGGAAGGGRSQVVPMEDLNLHLTGDFHAVAAANNLLAAYVDTSMLLKNPHGLDPFSIRVRRVVDINDRALRRIVIGCGGRRNGMPRETGFDIVAASEIMAILGLSTGYKDMRLRLGRILVGRNGERRDVTAVELHARGAMAVILKEALKPNLMQTTEGTPVLIHTGPFANIAHGNSSILADEIGLHLADFLVTEAGFGADMGAEKFFNIKCRVSGRRPDAVVVVATTRALKAHGAGIHLKAGQALDPVLLEENRELLDRGIPNLSKMIEIVARHGLPSVVAVNRFETEKGEVFVKRQCMHCCQPACVAGCPVKAMQKMPEGPVIWEENCIGCKTCIFSCPFGIPTLENKAFPKIQKCILCWPRLKEGKIPACVEACPQEALIFGTRRELLEEARARIYQHPDRYVHYIYGEHEIGGTCWLYLSSVPFEQIGLRTDLDNVALPRHTTGFLYAVPLVLVLWPTFLLGAWRTTERTEEE